MSFTVFSEPWTDEEKRTLRDLQHADRATLQRALPNRTWSAIMVAKLRCGNRVDNSRPPSRIDRDAVDRALNALPPHVILERLPGLLERGPLYKGSRKSVGA